MGKSDIFLFHGEGNNRREYKHFHLAKSKIDDEENVLLISFFLPVGTGTLNEVIEPWRLQVGLVVFQSNLIWRV